ncbi:putative MATE family efflux protein [Sediminihabitans luteus]|uniref:Putative MATE family efflux protein n=1 Tax=Sediminihabitans luteus TaxID=1138585 RepID=A0A2M9CD08_9CELL|nr:MATE family efflux transporter [Sediminihabitans luteus]PJJ69272.1 putative MATE family efflux protein [Sediminihabitans luteus]GII98949.1 MATE family efflux transporter [Sediminihabitans luteus]
MSGLTAFAPPAVRGDFARRLLLIALPITLQTIVFSSKGIVDAVMLGSQDGADVAAIGIASRATFVVTIFLIGLSTGAAQIGAQVWGSGAAGRETRLRQTVWLGWAASAVFGLVAFVAFFAFGEQVIGTSTSSPVVIERGAEFLKIVSFTFLLFPYTSSLAAGLRVMHQPTISMIYALVGVGLNVALNAVLIFGLLGAPAMGITGAAIGTLVSAVVETGLLWLHLRVRRHVLAAFPRAELRAVRRPEVGLLLRLSVPAALNSTLWALGVFVFYAIVGGASVESVTALAVLSPVESLSLAFTLGLANAAAVLVGGTLGARRPDDAYAQALGLIRVGVLVGAVTALVVWALKVPVLALFPGLSPASLDLTGTLYTLMAVSFVLKSVSMVMVLGVLRAGGEARFCLLLDVFAQWVVLLPLAAVLRFVVGVDPVWLYCLLLVEEAVRIAIAGRRIRSRKWLRSLVD